MSRNLSNNLCVIRIEHVHTCTFNVISVKSNNSIKISIKMKIEQKVFKIKIIYVKSHLCDITSILAWMQNVHIGKQCLLS